MTMIPNLGRRVSQTLYDHMFHMEMNANDFFAYACADSVEIDVCDLKWVCPVIRKFGAPGLHACMSYIEDCLPVKEYQCDEFKLALKWISDEIQPLVYSKIEEWPTELCHRVHQYRQDNGYDLKVTRAEQKGRK